MGITMFDLIFPLFVDVEEVRKAIDSGLATTADDLTNKQTLAEIALLWVKEELRRRRTI